MARPRRRSSFPDQSRPKKPVEQERIDSDESISGMFGFFREYGTRETIESIVIAVMLALMFKAFEAEAFIIPTGSMAPSLQGAHKDLACQGCGFQYRVGTSGENDQQRRGSRLVETYCPLCQYETRMVPKKYADHASNNGDRIIVNKFIYDFSEPERYDVIVFKNPNKGNQNYIKRLIGLPGDNILIENGDIYLMHKQEDGSWKREITRKPPHKLHHVLQTVDDTHFIPEAMSRQGWPSRWQEFSGTSQWQTGQRDGHPTFLTESTEQPAWLRYRHFRPYKSDWSEIDNDRLPQRFQNGQLPTGRLVGDHYAYNDGVYSDDRWSGLTDIGLHWVGDLGIEFVTEIESDQGTLLLDLVEGGIHFQCSIDVASGQATLSCDDPAITFHGSDNTAVEAPTAQTDLKGKGNYRIEFLNADDRLHLWVDGDLIEFDAAAYQRDGIAVPTYSEQDAGDAEPAGVAAQNLKMRITRLKIVRDIYYTAVWGDIKRIVVEPLQGRGEITNLENEAEEPNIGLIQTLFATPELWSSEKGLAYFKSHKNETKPMFQLVDSDDPAKDQYLPMGDNSPASLDGRVWDGPNYVERDMLIGRALFIYWPHTLNEPIPYFPNFWRMGFIR